MKSNIQINWWENEGQEYIPEEHSTELKEHGYERALELIKKGFSEGELHLEVEGEYYDGYWREL